MLSGMSFWLNTQKTLSLNLTLHFRPLITIILLQPLRWCCVECVIHHERDVSEEQHHSYM